MIRRKFVHDLFRRRSVLRNYRPYSNFHLPDDKIRNIAILAHIDAGKTTTTERMLFYSGKTQTVGEVHHGNTVTDFLVQERERGITICSAAVTLPWENHRINLLDTPGHIDFTMEVEQSLGAVDGVVIILDSSSGVEAQTVTVWHQANHYKLPRIVFANKMDRIDGNFDGCLDDLRRKLDCTPLAVQQPIKGEKGISGVIDLIDLKALHFDQEQGGQFYDEIPLTDEMLKNAIDKRCEIVDLLSGFDDTLANEVIKSDSLKDIKSSSVKQAIRTLTSKQIVVPVFLGSAYKNIGVQPLMNGVVSFLPAPSERDSAYDCFGKNFAGKVFKVMHDKQRGALSLIRILNGTLKKGDKITTTRGPSEMVEKIYEPLADEYCEINSVEKGNIGICSGLKSTVTGDLLLTKLHTLKEIEAKFNQGQKYFQPQIPDPVYFCSIEPPSLSQQSPLDKALEQLHREDPSFRIAYDKHTMQTVLSGMGALHLEVIKSRLLSEYKIDADLGPLQIAYQESISEPVRDTFELKKEIVGSNQLVQIEMSLCTDEKEIFSLDKHPDAVFALKQIHPKFIKCVKNAACEALERGPLVGGKVFNTQVVLHGLTLSRGVAESILMSATAQCIQKLLKQANCLLYEPLMAIQIIIPNIRSSPILSDLAKRRAEIREVTIRGENKIIHAVVPLSELSEYSMNIRKTSSGTASVSMQPNGFAAMTEDQAYHAIRRAQGLE